MINNAECLFHVPVVHLYVFFGEMSIQVLCPFVTYLGFLILSCMISLYNVDINSLSDISFVNVFFHVIGYIFILLMLSFAVQKFFSLM